MLQSDRASVDELCVDKWTVTDEGPMPACPDTFFVELDDEHDKSRAHGSRALLGGATWARRLAMYGAYAGVVGCILLLGATREAGGFAPRFELADAEHGGV